MRPKKGAWSGLVSIISTISSKLGRWGSQRKVQKIIKGLRKTNGHKSGIRPITCGSPFDILRTPNGLDARSLTRRELFLDGNTLDAHFRQVPKPLGVIDPIWGSRFGVRVAKRMVGKVAHRAGDRLGLDRRLIEKAWFFVVWTELCVLIPTRHLAKYLAKLAKDDPILIPISSFEFRMMPYWSRGELDLLYLAFALRQHRARVFLVVDAANLPGDASRTPTLSFELHPTWRRQPEVVPTLLEDREAAVVPAGIRGLNHVLTRLPRALKIDSAFAGQAIGIDANIFSDKDIRDPVTVQLAPHIDSRSQNEPCLFCVKAVCSDLGEWLITILGQTTKAAAERATALVDHHNVTEAHVCDHLFFESALVAHAVRKKGGRVFLWPHSSAPCNPDMHHRDEIFAVHCTTRATSEVWRRQLPDSACHIVSDLMLRPRLAPRETTSGAPLTVVVLGGAYALTRMPILDRRLHEESYRKLFRSLDALGENFRVLFKPKTTWETPDWLEGVLGQGLRVESIDVPPLQIEEPNLVFVSVSLASSALLEGLSRGIPGLIVREFSVEDELDVDTDFIQAGDVDKIVDIIRRCGEPSEYEALTRHQLEWYRLETHFECQS